MLAPPGPVFLDVEASSGFGGFPISVGIAVIDAAASTWTASQMFIRHDPWLDDLGRWSSDAEAVHRIGRSFLMAHGHRPAAVTKWMNSQLAGMTVYVDTGPVGHDKVWLDEMFAVAGVQRLFAIADILDAFAGDPRIDMERYPEAITQAARQAPHTHDAADDAANLACTWLLSRRRFWGFFEIKGFAGT